MTTKKLLLASIVLCATLLPQTSTLNADTQRITFLAHGSFAADSKWFLPGSPFYEELKKEAALHDGIVIPWLWSGGVSDESIIEAAGRFVEELLLLPASTSINLCAHSNGGNVFAFATMLLAALYEETQEEPTTATRMPLFLKKPFLHKELTKNREVLYNMHPKTEAVLNKIFSHLKEKKEQGLPLHRSLTTYPINLFCCMGTPINPSRFDIDMRVVKQAISIYSPADFIQSMVGAQLWPEHERRANVQARLHHSKLSDTPIDPCHKNIRHALIGAALLDLPRILAATHENAAPYELQSGMVTFSETAEPEFKALSYSELLLLLSSPSHATLSASSDDEEAEEEDDSDFEW